METLEQPTQQSNETSQSEIDDLFSRYSKPAKRLDNEPLEKPNEEPKVIQAHVDTQTVPVVSQPVQQSADPDAPFGRYQRGKKKGDPRLTPYMSTKGVSSVPVVQQPINQPQQPVKLSGMLVDGGLFLMLINLCLPLFFSVVNNFFSQDKINPEKLKLTKEQIKELDPVCDAAMKQASVTGNPVMLLLLGICTAMGMNYMIWKMDNDSKKTKPQPK